MEHAKIPRVSLQKWKIGLNFQYESMKLESSQESNRIPFALRYHHPLFNFYRPFFLLYFIHIWWCWWAIKNNCGRILRKDTAHSTQHTYEWICISIAYNSSRINSQCAIERCTMDRPKTWIWIEWERKRNWKREKVKKK